MLPPSIELARLGSLAPALHRIAGLAAERTPGADAAHDFSHVQRVTVSAYALALDEGAELAVVLPAALLHELFNYPKNHPESHRSGEVAAERARELLRGEGYPAEHVDAVAYAIRVHPFSLGITPETLEARILQDSDRLDALGAIGIARCFATAAVLGSRLYAPEDPFCATRAPDDKAFAVDHFYRKLFKVPEGLHTEAARRRARERVVFMRSYLEALRAELGG